MTSLVTYVILVWLHLTTGNRPTGDMMKKWREVCPYIKYCTDQSNLTLQERDKTPCCHPCSCEPDCRLFRNCCPDVQHASSDVQTFPCTRLNLFLNDRRQVEIIPDQTKGYRIINKCPKNSPSEIGALCTFPKKLQDFVIVSDSKTREKVYANRYCADCHGVNDVIEWNIYVDRCVGLLKSTFKTFLERDEYVIKNCALMAIPPTDAIGQKSVCFNQHQNVIGQCNVTSWWHDYDFTLEFDCSKKGYRNNYVYQISRSGQFFIYKNPSCYLCNNPRQINSSQQCDKDALANEIGQQDGAFLIELNVNMASELVDNISDASRCHQYQIYDKITFQCLDLGCPAGHIPVLGACVPMLPGFITTNLETYFAILLPGPLRPDILTLHSGIMFNVNRLLQDRVDGLCEMCTSSLITDNSLTIYFLKYSIQTSEQCPLKTLIIVLQHMSFKGFQYEVKDVLNRTLKATVIPILERFPKQETVLSFLRGAYRCSSSIRYDISMVQFCPKVNISIEILFNLGINITVNSSRENELYLSSWDKETSASSAEGYVAICVNDYLQLLSKYSPNENTNKTDSVKVTTETEQTSACSFFCSSMKTSHVLFTATVSVFEFSLYNTIIN